MVANCIFCKIVEGSIPAVKVAEHKDIIVIQDIAPKAPIHLLIIPKKHIHDVTSCTPADMSIFPALFAAAQEVAQQVGAPSFRLLLNNGVDAGQTVFHLHMHFLAGKQMSGF